MKLDVIKWHEKCKFKCRLDAIVCSNKQRWNKNKCRYECKELIDKGVCDKEFIYNSSNCECECNKNCHIGEYLDYENCKCRKKIVDKLIDECKEIKLPEIIPFENENNYKYNSCIVYIVLMIVAFKIFTGITVYLVYHNWYLIKNNISCIKFNTHKETEIWWIKYIKW